MEVAAVDWAAQLRRSRNSQNRTVVLGRYFHANLVFWKWAIDHELLHKGEALSDPCYTAIPLPGKKTIPVRRQFRGSGRFSCREEGNLDIRLAYRTDRRAKWKRRSTRDLSYHDLAVRVIGHSRDHVGHA